MIGIFCLLAGLSLLWSTALAPILEARRARAYARATARIELYKCFAIQNYYPGLEHLSLNELKELYDIDSVYNQIGRFKQ